MNKTFRAYVTSATFNFSLSNAQIKFLSGVWTDMTQSVRLKLLAKKYGRDSFGEQTNIRFLVGSFYVSNDGATRTSLQKKGLITIEYKYDNCNNIDCRILLTKAGKHICILLKESGLLVLWHKPGEKIEDKWLAQEQAEEREENHAVENSNREMGYDIKQYARDSGEWVQFDRKTY